MTLDLTQLQSLWDEFSREWPIERLSRMTLPEYTAAGDGSTFTSWIDSRLAALGSIRGGSAFKFGIFSRAHHDARNCSHGHDYSDDYAWYSKYGGGPEEAFAKVRSLVSQTASAAAQADYAAIEEIDLGDAYKWKVAFHYQNFGRPGVIAVFKRERLEAFLRNHDVAIPGATFEIYRAVLTFRRDRHLLSFSQDVWNEAASGHERWA